MNVNRLAGIGLFILGLLIWWFSGQFPNLPEGYPGPSLFPRVIAIGLLGISVYLMFLTDTKNGFDNISETNSTKKRTLRLFIGLVLISTFPLIAPLIGIVFSLIICGFVMGLLFDLSWLQSGVVATLTSVVLYIIFAHLLGVPL